MFMYFIQSILIALKRFNIFIVIKLLEFHSTDTGFIVAISLLSPNRMLNPRGALDTHYTHIKQMQNVSILI